MDELAARITALAHGALHIRPPRRTGAKLRRAVSPVRNAAPYHPGVFVTWLDELPGGRPLDDSR